METEYFITFPDDLLEAANLKPGDEIEWVDRNDGTFILRKPNVIETNS
jgi:bifunctional DNA-binding transcriptional regulator/antitoxin component of YhaV-PrlF toxin-antitoxin module